MSTSDVREREMKILVIGSKGHARAHCIDWLEPFPNIEEYDSVIINLPTLTQEILSKIGGRSIEHLKNSISTLFRTNREIFCIMNKLMSTVVSSFPGGAKAVTLSNYDWFPQQLKIYTDKVGTSVLLHDLRFENYFRWIEQWNMELEVNLVAGLFDSFLQRFVPIAENKSKKIIAGTLKHNPQYLPQEKGAIHLLPLPTKCNNVKAVEILLDIILGEEKRIEPVWRKEVEIPGIQKIWERINKRVKVIEGIQKEISQYYSQIAELDSYRDLLSASGEDLETIVHKVLSEIGISTKKAERGFPVDLISDKIAVEVTGIKDSVGVDSEKVIQTARFKQNFQKNEKIILIANTYMDLKPSDREGKMDFTPEVKKYFDAINVCYMTSKTLFELWKDIKDKKRNAQSVVRTILKHKGELTLRDFD